MQLYQKSPKNQIYNGDFSLGRNTGFPDGWQKVGGDPSTVWIWNSNLGGARSVTIKHPSGPPAGIGQTNDLMIAADENQRWELRGVLDCYAEGTAAYLKVHFYDRAGLPIGDLLFNLQPSLFGESFSRIFAALAHTGSFLVEVGLAGPGRLTVSSLEAIRLYPLRELIKVDHIDSIGKIIDPISLAGPIQVDVQTTVTQEVRDLTPVRDGIKIFDSLGRQITSLAGLLGVGLGSRHFNEITDTLSPDGSPNPVFSTAAEVASFAATSWGLLNNGAGTVNAKLQISPDGTNWWGDSDDQIIPSGGSHVFVMNRFLRYGRLRLLSDLPATVRIWCQQQT